MDADSELMRRAHLTPANVNETQVADSLIAGDEEAVYGAQASVGTAPC
jgi:IS5 family transposase